MSLTGFNRLRRMQQVEEMKPEKITQVKEEVKEEPQVVEEVEVKEEIQEPIEESNEEKEVTRTNARKRR